MKPLVLYIGALLASIAIVMLAASFGGLFATGDWYKAIVKPSWNPPGWIFGPVWTFLYISMAVAAWLVWLRRGENGIYLALGIYAGQLVLNALWTAIFFGWHKMGLAFVDILLLDILIAACVFLFWPISRPAALLMVPYFLWVSFAAFLNLTLWRMNA
jgi:translocator protein